MSGNGYIPKRRGVLEHLQDGRLTLLEYAAYDAMILLADKSSGMWWGSAKALAAICGAGDLTERQARHLLESLGQKGYIRRFATAGKRGNYPILVNKFEVTFGARKGMRLNAERTSDWRNPVYESCQVQGEVQGEVRAPIREGERDREKNYRPAKERQADPRFQKVIEHYYSLMRAKGIEPTFDKSDGQQLATWLKRNPSRTIEDILRTLENAFESTDPFPLRHGFRLREFVAHEAKYQRGPLHRQSDAQETAAPIPSPRSVSRELNDEEAKDLKLRHGLIR